MVKLIEMLDLFRQGKTNAKSHMKNLVEMATADGVFVDEEEMLLKAIAAKNGVSAQRMKEIRSNPDAFAFQLPATPDERFSQLYDLVHMMIVDKEIHPDELYLIELFAIKFGYRRTAIDGVIKLIIKNIEKGTDVKQSFKDVQYYLEWAE
jgi:uncharacterized tellurite resistance protein B-like protein